MKITKLISILSLGAILLSAQTAFAQEKTENVKKIKIAAHRGYWKTCKAKHAQNSIRSLELTQLNKFWGSEFDVHLTTDGKILVHHDDDIDGKIIHTHKFADFNSCKLSNGEPIPTLGDYLMQSKKHPSTMMVLEVKDQGSDPLTIKLADECIQSLIKHDMLDPKKVMFITFNLAASKHLAKVAPQFINQYLYESDFNTLMTPQQLKEAGINGLDYYYKDIIKHPEWIKQAHDLGLSVNVWTVNKRKDIKKMIELGVDCITTNYPMRARRLIKKYANVVEDKAL